MTKKDFLFKLLEATTSRSLNSTYICIISKSDENDYVDYKICNISNYGNDTIFIEIEKE